MIDDIVIPGEKVLLNSADPCKGKLIAGLISIWLSISYTAETICGEPALCMWINFTGISIVYALTLA